MKRCLIASHDAGGAEIVSSWAVMNSHISFSFCLAGPALKIFTSKIPALQNTDIKKIDNLLNEVDWVLTGTSGKSDFERDIHQKTKTRGIKTVAFLDHWVNYEMRFQNKDGMLLPDEIWVGDQYAFEIAEKIFPQGMVKRHENPYWLEIAQKAKRLVPEAAEQEKIKILYVCEPIFSHYGYSEFIAMQHYFDYLLSLARSEAIEIRIRLHPSEQSAKYNELISQYKDHFVIYEALPADIVIDCQWADWVVGCETMAMVIGLQLDKKVFSNIPKGGKPCSLPFPNIERLFN